MAAREYLKTAQDVGEQPCYRGLSRAWVAGEDEMAFQLHRLAGVVPFLPLDVVDDGADLLLDLRQTCEGVDLVHNLLLGELLERFPLDVSGLDLASSTAEHIERAFLGDLSGQDSVLLCTPVPEHLLEDQSEFPLGIGADRCAEFLLDQRHAHSLEVAVLERGDAEAELKE